MQQPDLTQNDERLMTLVDLALAQPSGEREAYLRCACGNDAALFELARQYVQWDERMGNFLLDSLYSLEVFEVVFDPGQLLLGGRFRIVRKVGEGGMGIVYEAVDDQVNQRVAIKCAKTGFRKRLPPEVRHAREIAHSNVCKIFDIHKTPTDRGEIDFAVMEFLEGETLTERLHEGALPEKEAEPTGLENARYYPPSGAGKQPLIEFVCCRGVSKDDPEARQWLEKQRALRRPGSPSTANP